MPHPLSSDLREDVVAHVEAGHSCQHAAAGFGNSVSFVLNLMTLLAEAKSSGRLRCLIGIEACAVLTIGVQASGDGAWRPARAAVYVKSCVKRGKTDVADAAAICEAGTHASMLLTRSRAKLARRFLFFTARGALVHQCTQIGNAICAHMTEFGIIVPYGARNVDRLKEQ